MNRIKSYIFKNFEVLFPLLIITTLSLFLLMVRLKLTGSFFFLFLVWNLFLAVIPFGIAFLLKQQQAPKKIWVAAAFLTWLIFLPNAPYIVTDAIHLRHSGPFQIWLDAVMIFSFALGGLFCYLVSMRYMEIVLTQFISQRQINILFFGIHFLTGFGIYLGRFLRFNSWDIISEPFNLIFEIGGIILFPMENKLAWGITFGFGVLLYLLYKTAMFQKMVNQKS